MFAGERPHVPMVLKLFTKVFYCFKHFNRNGFTRRHKKKNTFSNLISRMASVNI